MSFMPGLFHAFLLACVGGCSALGFHNDMSTSEISLTYDTAASPLMRSHGSSIVRKDAAERTIETKATFPARWTETFSAEALAESQTSADLAAVRVKDAMKFCWAGYKKVAFGADDVRPLSGGQGNWARMGVSILESLDTLYLMGLKDEFSEADSFVREKLVIPEWSDDVQTMEITIRGLGGLLSAYSLTKKPEFLEKAHLLGRKILKSAYYFDASDTSGKQAQSLLPLPRIDLVRSRSENSLAEPINIAEAGTLQLEFRALSLLTGDPLFRRVSSRTTSAILDAIDARKHDGQQLFTDTVSDDGKTVRFLGGRISLGARGDSFLEYLIKQAVQDPHEARYRLFARQILDGVFENLVQKTKKGTTFIAELNDGKVGYHMDHLVCFLPGVLMLATHHFPKSEVDPRWKPLAASLTETCHKMYTLTDSHLAPELTIFDMTAEGSQPDMLVPDNAPWNLLRPEALEALFYMHYYTGDPKYRLWASDILTAFEQHSKGKYGFTSVDDVRQQKPRQRDSQESFFLAETLKYLYLVFAPHDTLNLDHFVLNTEAHPLKLTV